MGEPIHKRSVLALQENLQKIDLEAEFRLTNSDIIRLVVAFSTIDHTQKELFKAISSLQAGLNPEEYLRSAVKSGMKTEEAMAEIIDRLLERSSVDV